MTDSTTKETSKRLRQIRLEKGLTQIKLAEKAGINSNYYARVERGDIKPALETYKKIAKALGVRASDIFPF